MQVSTVCEGKESFDVMINVPGEALLISKDRGLSSIKNSVPQKSKNLSFTNLEK